MSNSTKYEVNSWLKDQEKSSKGLPLEPGENLDLACMAARLEKSNYRLAEAILAEQPTKDVLQYVRTHIARGRFEEARALISAVLAEYTDAALAPIRADLTLELSRIEYQNGNWALAIEAATHGLLDNDLRPVIRITLLQIRAAAFFEMQNWGSALQDIDSIYSLKLLYPGAQAAFYADVLRIKIIARLHTVARAREELQGLWLRSIRGDINLNFDAILTLLRLEIDLKRLNHEPYSVLAHACLMIADQMGDALYAALAWVDIAYAEDLQLRDAAITNLAPLREKFKRIDAIINEIETRAARSEYSRNVLKYQIKKMKGSHSYGQFQSLFILNPDIKITFLPNAVALTRLQGQTKNILKQLFQSKQGKEALFKNIWNLDFKAERHDIILRNALMRARKQTGLEITSKEGSIELKRGLIIDLGHDNSL